MSLRDCIINAQKEGTITDSQAKESLELYDELHTEYKKNNVDTTADTKAGSETFDILKKQNIQKKRQKLLQLKAVQQYNFLLETYPGEAGELIQDMIASYGKGTKKILSLEALEEIIKKRALSKFSNGLKEFGRGARGQVKSKATLDQLVKEVFGQDTGNPNAKALATEWKNTAEFLRNMANEYGMSIPKRTDWGMPQVHDKLRIMKSGRDAWVNFLIEGNYLDYNKMVNQRTGIQFTDLTIRRALEEVYENIVADGNGKIVANKGSKMLANTRQDHRWLVFKDSDKWLAYQNNFGEPNSFATMVSHIESMSRDIAQLQIFGPNPKAMLTYLKADMEKRYLRSGLSQKKPELARDHKAKIDMLYDIQMRKSEAPINSYVANSFGALRNTLQASQLGSAPLSAISDIQSQRITARMTGLPQAKLLKRVITQIVSLNPRDRGQLALRLGAGADNWTSTNISSARFFGDTSGPEITRRLADTIHRISGLSPMTQGGRQAFHMEVMNHLSINKNKSFSNIDPVLQKTFQRYDINDADWDIIRKSKTLKTDYGEFIDIHEIEASNLYSKNRVEQTITKLMHLVTSETESAVPSTSVRARSLLTGGAKKGTIGGEIVASASMYKNYPATIMHTHIMRFATEFRGTRRVGFFLDYIIGASLMGALALQLKAISRGKDPQNMEDPKFWGQALFQGGGLGIFGDFLQASTNRFGGGVKDTFSGPAIGFLEDTANLSIGNIRNLIQGDDTNFGAEFIRYMGRYTPGSSIWYMRLALERLLLERIQSVIDPKFNRNMRKRERYYRKHQNQNFWFRPGKTFPTRPPNLGKAFGD